MDASELFFQERRRHQRTQLQVTLRGLRLDPDGELMDNFHMIDISRSGLGAIVDRPYYKGQRVVLSLPVPEEGAPRRSVYATVVRCRGDREGYKVGLHFDGNSDAMWADNSNTVLAAA
jgi:hypothetical protein